jgi:MoaA/NifB/PqqE/SkfB family radical SAM enzyme
MSKSSFEIGVSLKPLFGYWERGLDLKYRKYRLKWLLASKKHKVYDFPIHIDIETTNNCNLRCVMCGINFAKEAFGAITWELFQKIIDEGVQHGLCSIKLNWRGEPLLHPRVVDMVRYAKEKGIVEVQFNTNGQLLTEEKARGLIEAGLDRIIFSVDGATKETYEKIRRGGIYERLVNNIETLLRLKKEMKKKLPLTRIQFVEMKENMHESELFKKTWEGKIDEVIVNPFLDMSYLDPNANEVDRSSGNLKLQERKPCNQIWQRLIFLLTGKLLMSWMAGTRAVFKEKTPAPPVTGSGREKI